MRILFVDDEINVLEGLMRMLHGMRTTWEMDFAIGGDEALAKMARQPFDVVVTDMRMPRMSGVELLTLVRSEYPDTIRFVLSGQSDQETALRSANTAHQFLAKPCDAGVLIESVGRAAALKGILDSKDLRMVAAKLKFVPSLPAVYYRLLDEMNRPEPSICRVATIVEEDIGMTAKLLQLVNSAFFGIPRTVERTADAASLLGIDTLQALITAVHVFGTFPAGAVPGFDLEALHRHSMRTAVVAKVIARQAALSRLEISRAFMAGVLHDIGKIVLAGISPRGYGNLLKAARRAHEDEWTWETRLFTTTHAELGGYLLGLWGFTYDLVEAVVHHHMPERCEAVGLCLADVVHCAGYLESGIAAGIPLEEMWLDMPYLQRKGIAPSLPGWYEVVKGVLGDASMDHLPEAA